MLILAALLFFSVIAGKLGTKYGVPVLGMFSLCIILFSGGRRFVDKHVIRFGHVEVF